MHIHKLTFFSIWLFPYINLNHLEIICVNENGTKLYYKNFSQNKLTTKTLQNIEFQIWLFTVIIGSAYDLFTFMLYAFLFISKISICTCFTSLWLFFSKLLNMLDKEPSGIFTYNRYIICCLICLITLAL